MGSFVLIPQSPSLVVSIFILRFCQVEVDLLWFMVRHFRNLNQVLRTVQCIHLYDLNPWFDFHVEPFIFMDDVYNNLGFNYFYNES